MSVIGTFTPTKDGGWTGSIRTLTIHAQVRFVPNDNRQNEKAPAFRIFVGRSRIGDAWSARSASQSSRNYLRVRLDDPNLPEPLNAALFESDDSKEAQLVWSRGRSDHQ